MVPPTRARRCLTGLFFFCSCAEREDAIGSRSKPRAVSRMQRPTWLNVNHFMLASSRWPEFYLDSERATYAPRPIMPRPEAVRWRARKVGLDLSLRSRGVARETTNRSAAVLRVTE